MQTKITIEELYTLYLQSGQKICTDTRKIEKDAIFFALKGDKFNANEFAKEALNLGCAFAVVDDERYVSSKQTLLVDNALSTLQQLANFHRKKFKFPFLGITGSNGKTTTKELIATVLSKKYNTLATLGNLNNHIGVPLTLLSIKAEHEFAIIEMGANHQGEIQQLCEITEPDFGIITNIGKAHLEGFGGIEGVKKGKSEMYHFINKNKGKVFINSDDEVLKSLVLGVSKITYGTDLNADCIGKELESEETICFKFKNNSDKRDWSNIHTIQTNIIGNYNFINCLAACCIGTYFGVSEVEIKNALENFHPNMNRSQLVKTGRNTIILDAYNANPNSMKAAIENFANMNTNKKLLLLGDMFELGDYSEQEHQNIVNLLIEKGFKELVLVGPHFFKTKNNSFNRFLSLKECVNYLASLNIEQYTVLIKGSRGMKMESLQEFL
jgi:UDP-N-acetylmuramoyl-tripeptide--D-alanyl-D-alanine ligase